MLLADLRDHMDLHGLGQAQEYLNNKLDTDNNSPLRRLLDAMQEFREVQQISLGVNLLASFNAMHVPSTSGTV